MFDVIGIGIIISTILIYGYIHSINNLSEDAIEALNAVGYAKDGNLVVSYVISDNDYKIRCNNRNKECLESLDIIRKELGLI